MLALQQTVFALQFFPEQFTDAAVVRKAVEQDGIALRERDFQIETIPAIFMTEDMLVEYVKIGRGAYLDRYCKTYSISKQTVLHRVIAADISYLQNIFGWHLSADTYQYARSLYDNEVHKAQWETSSQQFNAKIQRVLKA